MPKRLRNLVVNEGSLVDRGAGGNAKDPVKIALFKRADVEAEEQMAGKKITKLDEALESAPDVLKAHVAALDKSASEATASATEASERVAALEAEVQALTERAAAAEAQAQAAPADPDAMAKAAMPEDVRKRFEALEKEASEARQMAAEERDKRELAACVDLAKSYVGVPAEPSDLGATLHRIDKAVEADICTTEDRERLDTLLKAMAEAHQKARTFAAVGQDGGEDDDSAIGLLTKAARKLVADGQAKTEAEALVLAAKADPTTYRAYQAEMRARH